jgi:hypothetical protein
MQLDGSRCRRNLPNVEVEHGFTQNLTVRNGGVRVRLDDEQSREALLAIQVR